MRPTWITRISFENLRPVASLFSEDLAIDLGTVNTRVYARGRGIVVNDHPLSLSTAARERCAQWVKKPKRC